MKKLWLARIRFAELFGNKKPSRRAPRRAARLHLESLEQRLAPANTAPWST